MISVVESMTFTRKGRFVRNTVNGGQYNVFRVAPEEVRCRDIGMEDTITYSTFCP